MPGPDMGMNHPVRCATTASSAHSVMRVSRDAAFPAARMCRSVPR
jgi:hypothetical protein